MVKKETQKTVVLSVLLSKDASGFHVYIFSLVVVRGQHKGEGMAAAAQWKAMLYTH